MKQKNLIRRFSVGVLAALSIIGLGLSVEAAGSVYKPEAGKPVHYNWGWGSPRKGVSADRFTAVFDQSGSYSSGDYFLQTFADDGVKVQADGKWLINRWSDYNGKIDRALWLGVKGGRHTVKTQYLENVAQAAVFSDVVPFDSWLAYYYPNETLTGMPTAAKVISPSGNLKKLSEDFGSGGPAEGIGSDHFSARYTTAKRIPAGEYILRAKADDGIRVYVDGKLAVDRWSSSAFREDSVKIKISDRKDAKAGEKDIHWIEVEYFDSVATGKVEFVLEPFQKAVENSWVGEIFPNKNLQGTPYVIGGENSINQIPKLDFNWGWGNGSPHPAVRGDGFSARFTKKVNLEAGSYMFSANGDDGVRVKLDNQTIINSWPNTGFKEQKKLMSVKGGEHTITVEYFEGVGLANLFFDYRRYSQLPVQVGKEVRYNWGWGSPGNGLPADYFTRVFDQSGNYAGGDYFLQTFADDGVKVQADGKWLINRWSDYNGKVDRALWLGVKGGRHTVKTQYLENVAQAAVFSEVVPFDSWLAYYYPNETLTGMPVTAKVISPAGNLKKLSEDFGSGGPAAGMDTDRFSARYTTAKRIPAGEYILRAKADGGIRVYVDGKLAVDRWSNRGFREDSIKLNISDRTDAKAGEKDVHWIEVEYFDSVAPGKVEFFLEPFNQAVENTWVGEIFSNRDLQGTPYVIGGNNSTSPISKLDFNWGAGSPYPSVPVNNFSARFTKKLNLETGTYLFALNADDGARVFLDDQLIIDDWMNNDGNQKRQAIYVTGGAHTIRAEYNDAAGNANLTFDYEKLSSNKILYQQGDQVQYNWGQGSPETFPADGFEAVFDQSGSYRAGDYFIQTFADDGVKVNVDGQWLINRWTDYIGKVDRALWLDAGEGDHSVRTQYYENVAQAAVFSNVVPFDTWLAYYYPNETLSGMPAAAKIIQPSGEYKGLYEDLQDRSPAPGVDKDRFSARYTTAKRIPAGEYILRTKVDDGVRVYVDGKLVLDRWTNGAEREDAVKVNISDLSGAKPGERDVHWIEVEYYDSISVGKIDFSLEPFEKAFGNTWLGEIYPNTSFTGNPVIVGGNGSTNPIPELNETAGNWGAGSPSPLIPPDNFSAVFKKKFIVSKTGNYRLNLNADDGAKVYVDNKLVIDAWQSNSNRREAQLNLNAGEHQMKIEYVEYTGQANLTFSITDITGPTYSTTSSNYTLSQAVDIQMTRGPQTDLHAKYLREDALTKDANGNWMVNGSGWNVRGGPGTNYPVVGSINNGTRVGILKAVKTDGQPAWYQISAWINAARADVEYYVNPANFPEGSTPYFQFLKLSESAGLDVNEVNEKILTGKGILQGKASSFLDAGVKYGINEVYLISHALLETGNGASNLATGVVVSKVDGKAVEPKKVYNMYGINAKDSCPLQCGSEYAYKMDWTTPEKAIVGGAEFIANAYINQGQDTLYKMRWNPDAPGTHQYATDIGWAVKQVNRIKNLYDLLSNYTLVFEEPKYK